MLALRLATATTGVTPLSMPLAALRTTEAAERSAGIPAGDRDQMQANAYSTREPILERLAVEPTIRPSARSATLQPNAAMGERELWRVSARFGNDAVAGKDVG